MSDPQDQRAALAADTTPAGLSRRRFLGYVVAAPTLVTAARLGLAADVARADDVVVPSYGQIAEYYDLIDFLRDAQLPTSNLIQVVCNEDGTVGFDLHRTEVGQGITTSFAMIIADEIGLRLEDVRITLADARPELLFNQITGGSHSTYSLYTPVRVAAAVARERLLQAAAVKLGGETGRLEIVDSVVRAPDGRTIGIAELAVAAASLTTEPVDVELRATAGNGLVGTPRNRIDARALVTGAHRYALDLDVPDAKPTMIARPPTIDGRVRSFTNPQEILALPGVTDVAVVETGVAVRADTFGQCIDAIQHMQIDWDPGPAAGLDDADVQAELTAAEIPMVLPRLSDLHEQLADLGLDLTGGGILGRLLPLGGIVPDVVSETFTFAFQSNSPLEPNCAIADVRADSMELWSPLKNPIVSGQRIALDLGIPIENVTTHVTQGGGSFGRELFFDAAHDAARCSKAFGKPVKLMWHRIDEFRQGRTHPACRSTVAAMFDRNLGVLFYGQHHTSVQTDYTHGLGDIINATAADLPPDVRLRLGEFVDIDQPGAGSVGFSQTIFHLTQYVPYHFGVVEQLLNETNTKFRTSSMRNIYSPNVVTARELLVDRICRRIRADRYEFRRRSLKDERSRAVLDRVADVGGWGRSLPAGVGQGLGFHSEYKGRAACLIEVDARPSTVNRSIPNATTGPRVTRVVFAVDVGLPINPRGLEAQMMGGVLDGIANAFTYALHLEDGRFLEGSWDQAYYTRQWNVPFDVEIIVMPATTGTPGGAGEFGVAAAMAAAATAYAAATGSTPTHFPINHRAPLAFTPTATTPSVPQSPTNGLAHLPGR